MFLLFILVGKSYLWQLQHDVTVLCGRIHMALNHRNHRANKWNKENEIEFSQ